MINSVEKMQDYDFVLSDLGVLTYDLTEERIKLAGGGKSSRPTSAGHER